ncbi:hypothetical protein B0O80DRAFT_493938 [Mortierella sp. GBAus27b]|nr:hypothetical protein BGX31_011645 [Mortierella sp. GBA43]KAI8361367.1 hypothetical protein B0O80DRAFT_493938 [Mortierella sp. GBAus27b]
MIVGAGLAGLLLGILLDRAGIPYEIYERAKEIAPLGALMSLNANILAALEQLGLVEELYKVSKPNDSFHLYSDDFASQDLVLIGAMHNPDDSTVLGYTRLAFARYRFYDLLASKIAPEKIHFNKKVALIQQDKDGVMIQCSDGSTYKGDILVGADGAYSGVRQCLYQSMEKDGLLPIADTEEMSKGYVCMVGTTEPLDPAEYPGLTDKSSHAYQIIGKGTPYTASIYSRLNNWSAFSVPENKICWNVVVQLSTLEQSKNEKFCNSEWGPESNEPLIKEVESFRTPFGKTMGEIIAKTPKDRISRVFLEDKLFETWHHGRTVLIGDACHKLLPSAGQGAVSAMQDSVVLANCLYDLESLDPVHITETFQSYKDQRFPPVAEQYEASKMNAKILYGQTWTERALRYAVFNLMPRSVQTKYSSKGTELRPQASFLPLAPKRGTCHVIPQEPSKRFVKEQRIKVAAAQPHSA